MSLNREIIEHIAFLTEWGPHHVIADIGSGSGDDADNLYSIVKSNILCMDPLFKLGQYSRDDLWMVAADVLRSPVRDVSLDGAYISCLYHLIPDKNALLRAVYDVLKPGSYFIVITLSEQHLRNRFLNFYFSSLIDVDFLRYGSLTELYNIAENSDFMLINSREFLLRRETADESFFKNLRNKTWSSLNYIFDEEY